MARQALGRGLSVLFGDQSESATPATDVTEVVTELDVKLVQPGNCQPREDFKDAAIQELAQSIKAHGVIQPIVVRPHGNGRYELVAGERRWRAVRSLGNKTIPAIIRQIEPERRLELALIENLQRENLNPVEEARAYESLIRDQGLTQEQVAERVGKDRATVANTLRLLRLPEDVQEELRAGRLTTGHAKALLGLGEPARIREAARRVLKDGLSVRQIEELVRGEAGKPVTKKTPTRVVPSLKVQTITSVPKDVHDNAAEKKLSSSLATRVEIKRNKEGGQIQVQFNSEEELMRLYDLLSQKQSVKH
jgi:ParB family chromosome partitioning protein